jgi:DNA-nicking Smr family endonuclease
MSSDFDDKGRKKGKKLERSELTLWKNFTADIEPMHDIDWDAMEAEIDQAAKPPKNLPRETPVMARPKTETKKPSAQAPQLDRRTDEKLRKGQMEIEVRLDLHGYTQERAHGALLKYISNAYRQGKRCILVITGKGKSHAHDDQDWVFNVSVLRARLPEWLSEHPLSDMTLKYYPAQIKHGGEGAFYVYLRRQRD